MITGFNTDIEFDGVTYHVQTEDKGLETPMILSLVYQHGTILASKRSPYKDLIDGTFDKEILAERLQRQHKLICAAIQAGRIEDLKRMTMTSSSESADGLVVKKQTKRIAKKEKTGKPKAASKEKRKAKVKNVEKAVKEPEDGSDLVDSIEVPDWGVSIVEDVEVLGEAELVEEDIILSSDAVEVVKEYVEVEQIVHDELKVGFLKEYEFKSGDKKNISVRVFRGEKENIVDKASVMIKILGADFRPMIFHSKSNKKGIATVMVKLPKFRSGRAAILVRASVDGEETELRKVISQK